jgi:hypothetical protein
MLQTLSSPITLFGLTDEQSQLVTELSRSLLMTETQFCREVIMECTMMFLNDPARIGEIVKDTLEQRHRRVLNNRLSDG